MRVAGLPDPILYVGSYSDWSRSGEPIATGAEPGTPTVEALTGRWQPRQVRPLTGETWDALADAVPRGR